MREKISEDRAREEFGIFTNHEVMENGELRFRLCGRDGSAYIRTVATAEGGWQRSHFHLALKETYIVQNGWMALACLRGSDVEIVRLRVNDIVTTQPRVHHNIYLSAGAIVHTVKHGIGLIDDRHDSAECDDATLGIPASDLLEPSIDHFTIPGALQTKEPTNDSSHQ